VGHSAPPLSRHNDKNPSHASDELNGFFFCFHPTKTNTRKKRGKTKFGIEGGLYYPLLTIIIFDNLHPPLLQCLPYSDPSSICVTTQSKQSSIICIFRWILFYDVFARFSFSLQITYKFIIIIKSAKKRSR